MATMKGWSFRGTMADDLEDKDSEADHAAIVSLKIEIQAILQTEMDRQPQPIEGTRPYQYPHDQFQAYKSALAVAERAILNLNISLTELVTVRDSLSMAVKALNESFIFEGDPANLRILYDQIIDTYKKLVIDNNSNFATSLEQSLEFAETILDQIPPSANEIDQATDNLESLYLVGKLKSDSGKCLDIKGGVVAENVVIDTYSCHDGGSQLWRLTGGGQLKPFLNESLCLENDIYQSNITLRPCSGTELSLQQKWAHRPAGRIINAASGELPLKDSSGEERWSWIQSESNSRGQLANRRLQLESFDQTFSLFESRYQNLLRLDGTNPLNVRIIRLLGSVIQDDATLMLGKEVPLQLLLQDLTQTINDFFVEGNIKLVPDLTNYDIKIYGHLNQNQVTAESSCEDCTSSWVYQGGDIRAVENKDLCLTINSFGSGESRFRSAPNEISVTNFPLSLKECDLENDQQFSHGLDHYLTNADGSKVLAYNDLWDYQKEKTIFYATMMERRDEWWVKYRQHWYWKVSSVYDINQQIPYWPQFITAEMVSNFDIDVVTP